MNHYYKVQYSLIPYVRNVLVRNFHTCQMEKEADPYDPFIDNDAPEIKEKNNSPEVSDRRWYCITDCPPAKFRCIMQRARCEKISAEKGAFCVSKQEAEDVLYLTSLLKSVGLDESEVEVVDLSEAKAAVTLQYRRLERIEPEIEIEFDETELGFDDFGIASDEYEEDADGSENMGWSFFDILLETTGETPVTLPVILGGFEKRLREREPGSCLAELEMDGGELGFYKSERALRTAGFWSSVPELRIFENKKGGNNDVRELFFTGTVLDVLQYPPSIGDVCKCRLVIESKDIRFVYYTDYDGDVTPGDVVCGVGVLRLTGLE